MRCSFLQRMEIRIRSEYGDLYERDPCAGEVFSSVFDEEDLGGVVFALFSYLAGVWSEGGPFIRSVRHSFDDEDFLRLVFMDLEAGFTRNPAFPDRLSVFLYSKGFHGTLFYRVSRHLWLSGLKDRSFLVHSLSCRVLSVDIHPASSMGERFFLDHGTGFVMGETAVVGNDVSVLHGVTLGGNGKVSGLRHPIVEDGVLIGANATILGRVTIGAGSKVAACSVVLNDVPGGATVAGVPAKVVRSSLKSARPSLSMEHYFLES